MSTKRQRQRQQFGIVSLILMAVLAIAFVGARPSFGAEGTPAASPGASPVASPVATCDGVTAYLTMRARILLDREAILARAANPGALDARGASDVSLALAEVQDAIAQLAPPAVLAAYHLASILTFDLQSQTFAAIATGGIAGAIPQIEAASTAVDELLATEEAAKAVRDAHWATVDDVRGTPSP